MSKRKKKKTPAPESRYTKEGFLLSEEFQRDKGLLMSLLRDDQKYTVEEVKNLLDTFKKGQVK